MSLSAPLVGQRRKWKARNTQRKIFQQLEFSQVHILFTLRTCYIMSVMKLDISSFYVFVSPSLDTHTSISFHSFLINYPRNGIQEDGSSLILGFRFEKLDITPKSAQKIKPVLERWMKEAEERWVIYDILRMIANNPWERRCFFLKLDLQHINATLFLIYRIVSRSRN